MYDIEFFLLKECVILIELSKRAGPESPQKMKGLGRKIAARIISGLFSPARQSPKPGRASPSGLRAARKPAKKIEVCVIFFLHWTGLLDVVTLLGVTFWIIKTFMLFQIISILNLES